MKKGIGPIKLRMLLDDVDQMNFQELVRTKAQVEFRLGIAEAEFRKVLKEAKEKGGSK